MSERKCSPLEPPFRIIQEILGEGVGEDSEVILCSPFVKASSLQWILEQLPACTPVTLLTRWRPEEICAGVSDLEVWPIIKGRPQSNLCLLWELHAKMYRFGESILIGSANLTGSGLGLARNPNYEILALPECPAEMRTFEEHLLSVSTKVNNVIYDRMVASIGDLEDEPAPPPIGGEFSLEARPIAWIPRTRNPEHLIALYLGKEWELGASLRKAVEEDLLALSIPQGYSGDKFRKIVAAGLRERPFFRDLYAYCKEPRRFGEVRTWLSRGEWCSEKSPPATEIWQATIRWIAYFLPESLELSTPGEYSEVVRLIS